MPGATRELRPRGRTPQYALFIKTAREEQKRLHPEASFVFADFTRSCADRWNALNEDEKKPFKDLAELDKLRFEEEMQAFSRKKTLRGGGDGRKKKRAKDPNAPRKPLPGFLRYCNDERPKVKCQHTEYSVADVAKALGKSWRDAGPDVRQKYQAMSDGDKPRYDREMKLYKARGAAHHAQDDDDEEEDKHPALGATA